jgi:hypothetical protein
MKKILGLHLGGAHTKKSAVVRGSLGYRDGAGAPYFVLDVSIGNIGQTKHRDADTRLIEVISDLMPVDILCVDSATSLPSCSTCVLQCPGVPLCQVQDVNFMKVVSFQDTQNKTLEHGKGRHTRFVKMPQPYLERSLEYKLRTCSEHGSVKGNSDLEPTLGSNRAPISLRSMRFLKEFQAAFPKVEIWETPSLLASQGLSQAVLKKIPLLSEIRDSYLEKNANTFRGKLLRKLLSENELVFSPHIPSEITLHNNNYYFYESLFLENSIAWPTQH